MEEVVVTGMFTRKEDSYTGAVTTIKKEELQRVGNQNILQSLKNIDPSFQVLENNDFGSDPNRVPEIQMRGASSFTDMKDKYQTNPNQPLFIVDGFEQTIEKVMDMDMNRVASITLLKDATAKALYGSKGANGVVVIETLAPEKGKMRVSYTGNLNLQMPDLSSYNLANAAEKLEIEKRAGVYTSTGGNPIEQQQLDEKYNSYYNEVLRGVDTYWLSKPLRVGVGHKHSLTFEGGDDAVRYGVDFQYNDVAGVMKGSNRQTISVGFNLQYRYKSLIFQEQLSATFNKAKESPYGNFSEYARLNPYWRAYNEDGSIKEIMGDYELANYQGTKPIYNPLTNASINTKNQSSYTDITNNFYVEWLAFSGMRFKGRLGIVNRKDESEVFYPRDHTMFKDIDINSEEYFERGSYSMGNGKNFEYNADLSANYSKEFGRHLVFVNAQWSFSEKKYNSVEFAARGFANDKMDYITHAKEYATGAPTGSESLARETSALISTNYSYDNRYLLVEYYSPTIINTIKDGANPNEILWRGNKGSGDNDQESQNFPPSLYGNGYMNPSQNLVDIFPMANGYPINDAASGYDANNPYAGRDPRLGKYIFYNGSTISEKSITININEGNQDGVNVTENRSTRTGYYMRKRLRMDVNCNPASISKQPHYTPRIRYTEMYLNYAEAANEAWGPKNANGRDYSAYDVIKAIRKRAGIGGTNDAYLEACAASKDKMRELIRNERRLELCFE